jgi:hypothetical protein
MCYLQAKALTGDFAAVEKAAAQIILTEWQRGVRHPIELANNVIVAIETGSDLVGLRTLFPNKRA